MLNPASRGFFLAELFMAFVKLFVWLVNRDYLLRDLLSDLPNANSHARKKVLLVGVLEYSL